MRQLKGYKLVTQKMESLYSECYPDAAIKYCLRYPIKPRKHCGPLAVFKTLRAAKSFQHENERLFSCTYFPSARQYFSDGHRTRDGSFPIDTNFAYQVTLREEIKTPHKLKKDK